MPRTSSRRAAARRTSSRVVAKVIEEKKEKANGRPKRSSTRGKGRKPEEAPSGSSSRGKRSSSSSDNDNNNKEEESIEGGDEEQEASDPGDIDFSIEYSLKLLKVGAEVYIRDTPNVSIRDKSLIGKKGTIKKIDGAQGKPSTWYLVHLDSNNNTRNYKKANNSARKEYFLANSLVPASLDGSPRNFMPDSEVKAIARRGRRGKKSSAEEKGKVPLDKVPQEEWIGKQIVFAAGRYEGENAWILGYGSGLVHLIMGDDDPGSPPIIVSRISKQLIVVPEENEEIEAFDPEDYVGKEGVVNDGYGIDTRAYIANHGNGYLLVQLTGADRPYTVLKVKKQFTLDGSGNGDAVNRSGNGKKMKSKLGDGEEPQSKRQRTSRGTEEAVADDETAMNIDGDDDNSESKGDTKNSKKKNGGGKTSAKMSLKIRKPKAEDKSNSKGGVDRVKVNAKDGGDSPLSNAEMQRIAKRARDKMKAKEKVLKEQSIKRSTRTTKGQRYNQATYNKKSNVQMSERDREDAEAAAQFAAHVSLYHERVRKYMEREMERQKQCGRTDITDALVRIERQFGWDDGDSEDDNGATYEWENERNSDVFDAIIEYKCSMCKVPVQIRGGSCWNVACERCVLNPNNKKYIAACGSMYDNAATAAKDTKKKGGKKKRGRKALSTATVEAQKEDATTKEREALSESANKLHNFQLLAPVYFIGVPKPQPAFDMKKKASEATVPAKLMEYGAKLMMEEEGTKMFIDRDGEGNILKEKPLLPPMRQLEKDEADDEEPGEENLSRRSSRSTTAAMQKEIEAASKPKVRLTTRQKIDYMANIDSLYKPLDSRHDFLQKYDDDDGVPRLYRKDYDWQPTRATDFMTPMEYMRREDMSETDRQLLYTSNYGNIPILPSAKKYEKYIGNVVSGTIVQSNTDKNNLGPPLHPLDILRSRVAQEKQTERGNHYEACARRNEAIKILDDRRREAEAAAMANADPPPTLVITSKATEERATDTNIKEGKEKKKDEAATDNEDKPASDV